jgi:hypothetical protein
VEAGAGQPTVIPPPPAAPPSLSPPPSWPPYAYAAVAPPAWAPVPPPAGRPRRSRSTWLAWLATATSLALAVPALLGSRHPALGGLHTVTSISSEPWSAEFLDGRGTPARWDPCTPIHYVVDLAYAPAGALSDVRQSLARLALASGLTFADDGTREERPLRGRSAYQPEAYGDRWAPLLISWSPPQLTDLLGDPRAEAVTMPVAVPGPTGAGGSIVTAEVVLNAARQLPVGFGPGPSEGEVLLHELGHAVGLGHVDSRSEAMFPSVRGVAGYGAGDLAGLRALGRAAGCHPAPAAHALSAAPSTVD